MLIEPAKQFHAAHIEAAIGKPVGASPVEIRALEKTVGCDLPQAYKEFLLWMGKDHQGIFRGSAWFIDCLSSNRETLRNLLEEVESDYRVKDSDVVFFTHQGYMAAWFDATSADPDPTCWFIDDGMQEPRRSGVFSEVLLDDLQGLSQMP